MKPKEVEVDVIMTVSVRTKISVDDCDTEEDWDDEYGKSIEYNFDNCNLIGQAFEQLDIHDKMKSFKGWTVDDFQVFLT